MEPNPNSEHEDALRDDLSSGKGISVGAVGRPATIVFRSDVETTSVYVDEQGNVSVSRGALPSPNIVVEGDHDVLCAILQTREPTFAAPGTLRITVNAGAVRDFVVDIPKGHEMTNPLKELYD